MKPIRGPLFLAMWMAAQGCLPGLSPQASGAQQEQPRIRRLILKDGSFEPVIQYQIRGDRVRFLSADRHEWEEMPASHVDWPATERDAGEARAQAPAKAVREDFGPPLAAPGIRLPPDGGVFLLDVFRGNPELVGLTQSGADVNKNTARNILRGAINPIAGPRQTLELKGPHALVQAHVFNPAIYVSLDAESDQPPEQAPADSSDRYRIVKCDEKKGNRIVGVIDIAIYGKVRQQANEVAAKVESVDGSWVKITPAVALGPGEYALLEMLGKQGMNQFVWDFGVNPDAPENPGAKKAEPARQPPVLLKKPKSPKPRE